MIDKHIQSTAFASFNNKHGLLGNVFSYNNKPVHV